MHLLVKSILQLTAKALASYLTTSRHTCVQLHTMQRPSFVFKVGGARCIAQGGLALGFLLPQLP